MKVVINKCWGGFGLSHKAVMEYAKEKGFTLYAFVGKRNSDGSMVPLAEKNKFIPYDGNTDEWIIHYSKHPLENGNYINGSYFHVGDIERDDPALVSVVESLGEEANGSHAKLKIVEIPDGVEWEIDEYDGMESIHEKHESWG